MAPGPWWCVFDSSPPGCATCAQDAAQKKTQMSLECTTCSVPGTQVNGSSICENYCYKALSGTEITGAHAKWHPAMYLCIYIPLNRSSKGISSRSSTGLLSRMMKTLMVPASASLLCVTESDFCRPELLTRGWVSVPFLSYLQANWWFLFY